MKLNKQQSSVSFISENTAKYIEEQLANLSEPGGLIHAYDEVTGSLINVCAKKQGNDIDILSWSVYGPLSMDEAARDVAKEINLAVPQIPTKLH